MERRVVEVNKTSNELGSKVNRQLTSVGLSRQAGRPSWNPSVKFCLSVILQGLGYQRWSVQVLDDRVVGWAYPRTKGVARGRRQGFGTHSIAVLSPVQRPQLPTTTAQPSLPLSMARRPSQAWAWSPGLPPCRSLTAG